MYCMQKLGKNFKSFVPKQNFLTFYELVEVLSYIYYFIFFFFKIYLGAGAVV